MRMHRADFSRGPAERYQRLVRNKKITSVVVAVVLLALGGVGLALGSTFADGLTWRKGSSSDLVFPEMGGPGYYASEQSSYLSSSSIQKVMIGSTELTRGQYVVKSTITRGYGLDEGRSLMRQYNVFALKPEYLQTLTSGNYTMTVYWAPSQYNPSEYTTTASFAVEPATYTLSFNAAGGSGVPGSVSCTTDGDSCVVTIPSNIPTRASCTFLGYSATETATSATYEPGDSVTLTSSTNLYAIWRRDASAATYIVTFDANGGSVLETSRAVAAGNALGTYLPTPTREGYAFIGWYTAVSGGEQVAASTVPTGDTTYYAHWTANVIDPDPGSDDPVFMEYEIIEISSITYTIGSGDDLVIRGSGELADFQGFRIDGAEVDGSHYTKASGSTVLTVDSDYLDTLDVGTHVATLAWVDGEVSVDFVVMPSANLNDGGDGDDAISESDGGNESNDGEGDNNSINGTVLMVPNTGVNGEDGGGVTPMWMLAGGAVMAVMGLMIVKRKHHKTDFGKK